MKRRIVGGMLLLGVAGTAFAADPAGPPSAEQVLERVDRRLDRVGATEEQRTEIHRLVETSIEKRASFHEEARALRDGATDLLWARDIDEAGLEALRQKGVDLFDRMTAFSLHQMVAVAQVLTPEQRVAVHELADR